MTSLLSRSRPIATAGAHLAPAVALVVALLICTIVPWFRPFPGDELVATLAWSLAHLGAFAGWGSLLSRATGWSTLRPSISLRAMWGASLLAALGGLLAACSLLGRWFFVGFVVLGVALQIATWVHERTAIARDFRARIRATRTHFGAFVLVAFVAAAVAVHYLGGASDLTQNPYDDEPAYYTFAKMLLERGTLLEPYSFRRMSTLGGQALFHASLLTRLSIAHINVFDRAMCILLTAGMVASFRVNGRRPPMFARLTGLLVVLILPDTSINSASYYSGIPFFLALTQSYEPLGKLAHASLTQTARRLVPLALVGAAACTLRQNYQATVGLFVVFAYATAMLRARKHGAWRPVFREMVVCLGLLALFVLPWMLLLYRSNHTLLFPIMKGTFNPQVDVSSQIMTPRKVLRFVVEVWLTPEPMSAQLLIFIAAFAARDPGKRATMKSLAGASALSVVMLSVAFSLSDSGNLARYYYGFVAAMCLSVWFNLASTWHPARKSTYLPFAMAFFAVGYTIIAYHLHTAPLYARLLKDTDEQMRRSLPEQMEPPVAFAYRRMQNAAPAGAPILYMLDRPHFFDFGRNPLLNLDTPGIASPAPGMPNFVGEEALASYLVGQGIHHVAFVRSEHSAFFYKKEVWIENMYDDDEIWRAYAPYILDTIESLEALSRTRRILHEEAGMLILDLDQRTVAQ